MIPYRRLPLEQYFTDTSEDFSKKHNIRTKVRYTPVKYYANKFEKKVKMHRKVDYAVFYEPDRNVIQVHFQRTVGVLDWLSNFEFAEKYYDSFNTEDGEVGLYVHRGWATMYKAVKKCVREEWSKIHSEHPDAYTEIIGWSLGSGQAILCAQDLNWNFGVKPYLYTYGSVRPFRSHKGNEEVLDRYLSGICSDCLNIADRNDIVTYMPPFKGFRMISKKEVGTKKKNFIRLLNPLKYHTYYYNRFLYGDFEKEDRRS